MPDNNTNTSDIDSLGKIPFSPFLSTSPSPAITGTHQDLLEVAARRQREEPENTGQAAMETLWPEKYSPPEPTPEMSDENMWAYGHLLPGDRKREDSTEQETVPVESVADPVRLSPEAYENIQHKYDTLSMDYVFRQVSDWQLTPERAEYAIATMTPSERLDTLAWAERDVSMMLEIIRDSGLPSPEEVEKYSRETGMPRDIVRDLLPHAKDELEARSMAVYLLDTYGSVEALKNSHAMNQIQNPDESYWFYNDVQAKSRFEAALTERHGDMIAAITGNGPVGRFADQAWHRIKAGHDVIGRSGWQNVLGWVSSGAELLGADGVHDWAFSRSDKIRRQERYPTLNTGNFKTDWIMDRLLIDTQDFGAQMYTWWAFGPVWGSRFRFMGMMGNSLSSMEQDGVGLAPRFVSSALNASVQRGIEEKLQFPAIQRISKSIGKIPASGRPLGQFLLSRGKNALEQIPEEYLQGITNKLSHDLAYFFSEGSTWQGFEERFSEGWLDPVGDGVAAFTASVAMMGIAMPTAVKSHFVHRRKLNSVQKVLDASKDDSQRKVNPEAFRQSVRPLVENALRYNQDAPTEVYLTAERFDEIIPDGNERQQLLKTMGVNDEYRRSRSTGALMAIKIGDYATAIAGHIKEAEFQKFIQVDMDGPSAVDEQKMEEVFANLKAESDSLVKQMWDEKGQSELPPELQLLRNDLRAIDNLTAIEADQISALRYSMVKIAAAELGVTPGEYIRSHNVRTQFADMVADQAKLDALIEQSDTFFAELDTQANEPTAVESPGDSATITPGTAESSANVDSEAAPVTAPEDSTPATDVPPKQQYTATSAERAYADKQAANIEAKRIELGNILLKGGHLSGEALRPYGLTAWHPQSVRMRMGDMKREAETWRQFQDPALIAQVMNDISAPLPSKRTANQQTVRLDEVIKASRKIGELFDAVLENPSANNKKYLDYQSIQDSEKSFLKTETGLDIDAVTTHVIDASAIHHMINRHGEGRETRPDHLPLTKDDILLIPWVINNPDKVSYAGKNDHGLDCIQYEKEIDGNIIVIEELRTGRKKLAIDTMRKIRSNPDALKPTSETSPAPKAGAYNDAGLLQNHAANNSTIQPDTGVVKPLVESVPDSGIVDADPDTWMQAAVNEVADVAGLDGENRRILTEGALEVLRAAEDMPEAKALAESMGLVAPEKESEKAGRKTKVTFPAEAGAPPLPARYTLVELDSLQPSHIFRNYTPNPAWTTAELAQQRNYDSGAMEVIRQGMELDRLNYDTLFNPATDAVNGPPIITQDGKVLGGNNRSHRIYNRYEADAYRDNLLFHLQGEDNLTGIRPDAIQSMQKPVLVRMVDGVDASDVPGLVGALNADFTTRRDPANLAANRGMRVGKKTMLAFAAINDQTIAAYLDSPERARKVLQAMVEDGALQQTDLPGLYDFTNDKWLGDGRANGKAQVEQALFGAILPDSRLLDDMAEGMKKKLVRALPALIRLKKSNSPELGHLVQAMAWHAGYADFRSTAEAKGLKPAAQLELFRRPNQKNLFTGEAAGEKSGPAWDMFTDLSAMRSQKEVAEYFTKKADDLAGYSRGLFGQATMAGEGVRGDVTFYDRVTLIRLFRGKSDFSTVLHEMGHVFLQELQDRVADGFASDTSVAALETFRKLAGGEFTEKGVEKITKHWEAYLREGRAPSRELVDAFGTFRAWLTGVYEDIGKYLGSEELGSETRDAFDHLLAADKEIREVRDYYYATRDQLESLNVYTPSDRKKIEEARKKVEESEQEFQDRMRISAYLRAYESREPVMERATADTNALPVYKAIADAVEAGGINANEAIDIIGRDAVEKIRQAHGADLFGGRESTLDAVAGNHGFADGRELLDALLNTKSKADAIKEHIRQSIFERGEKAREWLKETEAVPGDAAYHASGRLELMALQLEGLRKILNQNTQKRIERLNVKALRDAAETTVRDMLVRDIGQHRRYAMAESRLGRESVRAAQAGDYQTAYDKLQLQMFNHAITAAMYRYRESREKFRRAHTIRKMVRTLDTMHDDSREALRQLLTRYGVVLRPVDTVGTNGQRTRTWVTPKELRPITGFKELALPDSIKKGEFDQGGSLNGESDNLSHFRMDLREHIEPWILKMERPADFQNWRDLTVRQMEDLRDALDLISTHGKGELTALRTDRYKNIEEAILGIVDEIEKHGPERSAINDPDTKSGQRKNDLQSFILKGVNLDSVFAVAEGNRSMADKEALQVYVERLRDCESRETNWHKDIMSRLLPSFHKFGEEALRMDAKIKKNGGAVEGLPFHESLKKARGKSRFTGEMLVSAILNTGNADNLFQLQNAYEWNDEHIAILRKQLSLESWQAVENIWREMDKLYPEMDKIRFWATHKHSPKEKGQPFTTETADGQIHESEGGYYPLSYDGLISRRQGTFQDLSNAKSMAKANMTYTSNKPASGFAIARARGKNDELIYKGPPLLKLSPILNHFHDVLHFVTHAQALYEIDRITADSRFEKAFVSHNGLEAYKLVRKKVNYLADFRQEQRGGRLMNWLHDRYITSVLGVNFYSASKQRLGYFTAISPMADAVITGENGTVVSLKYLCNAMWDFGVKGNIGIMTKRFEAIKDESRIMKARDEGGATQETRNAIAAVSPTGGDMRIAGMTIPVKAFRDNLFKLIQLFDRGTAGPIHTACYRMYMDGKVKDLTGMTEAEKKKGALAFADSNAMTQTSPFRVDHSAIQRGENIIDKFSAVCISGVMQPGNMLYQKIAGARRGQVTPGQVASYIAKTYIAMSYTQMLFSTLRGLAIGEEDPLPAWYEFILAPLDNMVSWIPYVRNIVSVSKYGSRGKGVPQLEAGYNALVAQPINAIKKAEKGEHKAATWQAVKSFSFAAGIPIPMAAKIYQDIEKVVVGAKPKKKKRKK